MSVRAKTTPPNYAEVMQQLLTGQVGEEEAARLLGYSLKWLKRQRSKTIAESMAEGGRAAQEVTQAMIQGALQNVASRADEIYEIAMDAGDMEVALAANTQLHEIVKSAARMAGVGERAAEVAAGNITQIGQVAIHNMVAIPGLKLHEPVIDAQAVQE